MDLRLNSRRARALHAFVLACLLLLGSLGDSIHRSQVAHAVCAEHGDIVHVSLPLPDAVPSTADSDSVGQERSPVVPVVRGVEPTIGDVHDACTFAAFARSGGLPSIQAPPTIVAIAVARVPEARPETPRVADIPRFLLAPKHGPPA